MFHTWQFDLGRPESIAAATDAAAWVAIIMICTIDPAAGWGSLCYRVNVPVHKFFAGMGVIMLVSGNIWIGCVQLVAAVLALRHISSIKRVDHRTEAPAVVTEEFLHFV